MDIGKLRDYCLNPAHSRGRHRARTFQSALGMKAQHADVLHDQLLLAAREEDANPPKMDAYGQRYAIDSTVIHDGRRATVRSAWIVLSGEDAPRLASCYVLLK